MILKKFYSPDPDESGGEPKEEKKIISGKPDPAATSIVDADDNDLEAAFFGTETPIKKAEPVKKEEPKKVEAPKKETPKKVEAKVEPEKKGEPVKKVEPEKKEEPKKEEDDDVPVFIIPKDDDEPGTAEESNEGSFIELGKALGFVPKEETFEAFKEAQETFLTEKITAAKSEASKIATVFEKLPENIKEFINIFETDPTANILDFINPLQQYDEVIALDDISLLKKNLEVAGWKEDKIEKQMTKYEEDPDQAEIDAEVLRGQLRTAKKNDFEALVTEKANAVKNISTTTSAERQKEDKIIVDKIKEVTDFRGLPVDQKTRDFLTKQWNSGKVRSLFQKDPLAVVNFMLNYFFGDQAFEAAAGENFEKSTGKIIKRLSKTIPIDELGGRHVHKKETQGFDSWEEAMNGEEQVQQ